MTFSEDGVSPDPKKVEYLKNSLETKNVSEVRSLLGMAQYSARFIPNLATVTESLRVLTEKETRVGMGESPNECLSGNEGSTGGMCYDSVF